MFCPKCGVENVEGVQLCKSCSWVLASTSVVEVCQDAKTSGLAITSLVLTILVPFTFLLTTLPAIIFGIVALVKIEKSGGRLKGKGLAIAGIAAPAILLPVCLMLLAIMMPALGKARGVNPMQGGHDERASLPAFQREVFFQGPARIGKADRGTGPDQGTGRQRRAPLPGRTGSLLRQARCPHDHWRQVRAQLEGHHAGHDDLCV